MEEKNNNRDIVTFLSCSPYDRPLVRRFTPDLRVSSAVCDRGGGEIVRDDIRLSGKRTVENCRRETRRLLKIRPNGTESPGGVCSLVGALCATLCYTEYANCLQRRSDKKIKINTSRVVRKF